jgi:PAS domain S-box-containing protein
MSTHPRVSVASVVAAVLVTVTTVVLTTFGVLEYRSQRQAAWAELHHELSAQADQLAVALALPVWNIDRAQIDKIVEGLASNPTVRAVSVTAAGRIHARVRDAPWELAPARFAPAAPGDVVEERAIVFAGDRIGNLRLAATPRFLEAELRQSLTDTVAAIVVVDAVLILGVYFVLWRTVLRPLWAIETYALAVSTAGSQKTASIGPTRTRDLENLRTSIEMMVVLLDRRYEELRTSREMFEKVFRSNFALMVVGRLGGGIVDANDAMLEAFGLRREEVIGRTSVDIGLWDSPTRDAWAARLAGEGRVRNSAIEFTGTHGLRSTLMSGEVLDVGGEKYVLLMANDITEQLAAERRLLESQDRLRRQETLASIGSLVAGVAHEVRTPLFSMSATLDAFEGGTPEEHEESAELLRAQVQRLSNLMSELLEYGRPATLRLERGGIAEVVQRAVRTCQPIATEAAVAVDTFLPMDALSVDRDASRLEQAIQNLVANAVQHSPRGGRVRVVVEEARQDGKACVLCCVEDEGPGIPEENLPRMFEPFFTRRKGGTGLGLSIVQRIVEAHGGTVAAANRAKGGAVFTIALPRVAEEEVGNV